LTRATAAEVQQGYHAYSNAAAGRHHTSPTSLTSPQLHYQGNGVYGQRPPAAEPSRAHAYSSYASPQPRAEAPPLSEFYNRRPTVSVPGARAGGASPPLSPTELANRRRQAHQGKLWESDFNPREPEAFNPRAHEAFNPHEPASSSRAPSHSAAPTSAAYAASPSHGYLQAGAAPTHSSGAYAYQSYPTVTPYPSHQSHQPTRSFHPTAAQSHPAARAQPAYPAYTPSSSAARPPSHPAAAVVDDGFDPRAAVGAAMGAAAAGMAAASAAAAELAAGMAAGFTGGGTTAAGGSGAAGGMPLERRLSTRSQMAMSSLAQYESKLEQIIRQVCNRGCL
jgi:hypothetical protein